MHKDKDYPHSHGKACEMAEIAKSTSKRWNKDDLLNMPGVFKRIWDKKNKTDNVCFSDFGIKYLKWLKGFSGKDKDNAFYIRIILDAIKKGRIDKSKVGWPPK